MIKLPFSRAVLFTFPLAVGAVLSGCSTTSSQLDTKTHYLYESSAPAPAVASRSMRPSAPAHRPSRVEPAVDTSAPGAPLLRLRSTPPTLRDRTGAPVPIVPESSTALPPAARVARKSAEPAATPVAGRGDFVIQYINGAITKVSVTKKTGNRALDRKSTEWIRTKFRVRPGATGQSSLTLVWREDRDRPTPQFHAI